MNTPFVPPLGPEGQHITLVILSLWAFVFVVSFFLYESGTRRYLSVELLIAVLAAATLGAAAFFALVQADVIL